MLLPRASELLAVVKTLLLLLPVLVVRPLTQLSPPARKMLPLCGRMICELQKMSVPVVFGSVRCPPPEGPAIGSHTS